MFGLCFLVFGLRRNSFWSMAADIKLFFPHLVCVTVVNETLAGGIVGFQIFAWAPK